METKINKKRKTSVGVINIESEGLTFHALRTVLFLPRHLYWVTKSLIFFAKKSGNLTAELSDIVSGKHTKNNRKLNSTQSLTDFCLIQIFLQNSNCDFYF